MRKAEEKRVRVAEEIVKTEFSYVKSLKTLIEVFVDPLFRMTKEDQFADLSCKTLEIIFLGLKEIHQCHEDFSRTLSAALKESSGSLGNVFVEKSSFMLELYPKFVNNFNRSHALLWDTLRCYPKVAEFVKKAEKASVCQRQDLESFMILPIQRIPRYVMLLKQLATLTFDHVSSGQLQQAIARMEEIATAINECKRQADAERAEVVKAQANINAEAGVHLPDSGKLVREGYLMFQQDKMFKCRYLFLFDDVLVLTKEASLGFFLIEQVPLSSFLDVRPIGRSRRDLRFALLANEKKYIFEGSSMEELRRWVEAMKQLISQKTFVLPAPKIPGHLEKTSLSILSSRPALRKSTGKIQSSSRIAARSERRKSGRKDNAS